VILLVGASELVAACCPLTTQNSNERADRFTAFSLRQPPWTWRLCSLSARQQEAFIGES